MNKIIAIIIVVILIVLGGIFFFQTQSNQKNGSEKPTGQIVISITDAAASMQNVSKVMLTISDVQMRSAAGGYVTVATGDETYSLLELDKSGQIMLYAKSEIPTGVYDQVRVAMEGVTVVTKDGVKHEAVMVDDNFEVEGTVVVQEDENISTVTIDFLANKSLHTTEDGKYIFAPVVTLSVRSDAEVNISADTGEVRITGGKVTENTTVGMTLSGDTEIDFTLESNAELEILGDGTVQIVGGAKTNATIESPPLPKEEATLDETVERAGETIEDAVEIGAEASAGVTGSL